jgi:HrpA-like RNA helicase
VLVFLPGVGEISRVGGILAQEGERGLRGAVTVPLHGNLSPQQQDKAIR